MNSPNIAERNPLAYRSELKPVWCPGCGDYGVLASMYQALSRRNVPPEDVVIVAGIGCSGRLPGYVNAYGFHGVHGRTLPIATGVKLANPSLTVFAVGGDGDGLAIGGGHIPHTARRNVDITYLMMDNSIYAQTKGQSSPTTSRDSESASMPYGTVEDPLNPIAMAIAYGVSFVARGYAARSQQLVELISRAMDHQGFSFIHVISPCVTHLDT
ncbi:MAG: thiamine pyrophosphate-dependent enzyme [Dehalococcoidia bacterium]|nr:thiamine pyrophosphate-dependent enzyme [Dehalococcoidia bacterium]